MEKSSLNSLSQLTQPRLAGISPPSQLIPGISTSFWFNWGFLWPAPNWKHSVFLEKGFLLAPQLGSNFPISTDRFSSLLLVIYFKFHWLLTQCLQCKWETFHSERPKGEFGLPGCFLTDFFRNTSESLQVFLVNQMTQKC